MVGVLGIASLLRFWQLAAVGFNSDEAVYTGTAASIAGNDTLRSMFPVFRAHPLLLQLLLSVQLHDHASDWEARAVTAGIGIVTVLLTYLLGRKLYGHWAGLIAALLLAVMPYHVLVSRQVLLDGLMTLLATLVLYCVIRYSETGSASWMLAVGATMGATVLAKETSIILVGGLYAFFTLTPSIKIRLAHVLAGVAVMACVVLAFPLSLSLAGRSSTGQHYLLWQLFRRANHGTLFYARVVPPAVGWLVLALALIGLAWLRGENTWRERLLLCWIAVPIVFFTLWPVKGYQYLLPVAPVVALLAGRTIARLGTTQLLADRRRVAALFVGTLAAVTTLSLVTSTWSKINPRPDASFLAGTGGVPGGREAGEWLRNNVPADAQILAIGPSMANIVEFYGYRRTFALSVSPSPTNRNPAYVPVANPDLALRQGRFQYLVWDVYSATRSPAFAKKMTEFVQRYYGVAVFTASSASRSSFGSALPFRSVVIYQVRQR